MSSRSRISPRPEMFPCGCEVYGTHGKKRTRSIQYLILNDGSLVCRCGGRWGLGFVAIGAPVGQTPVTVETPK